VKAKVTAIIPARKGSKGFPNKNIALLRDKPVILYTIEAAINSKLITDIIVTTDDPRVKAIARQYNVTVEDRPPELAKDDSLIHDVILNLWPKKKEEVQSTDLLVLLQPTSPLRTSADIDQALNLFLASTADSLVSVVELDHPLHWTFKIKDNYLKPVFDSADLQKRRQDLAKTYIPNGAIYVTTWGNYIINNSFLSDKTLPFLMSPKNSIDIDREFDLELINFIIANE
jgi:CMP-N-acetylneuraminic acid synthetase